MVELMKHDVIVIGAGIAGISAAIKLIKSGKSVLVIEQNSFPGGRSYSFRDKVSGELIDNGQHLMTGAYSDFLEITKCLGTKDFLSMQKSLQIDFYSQKGNDLLDCSLLPGKAGVLLGLMKMKNLTLASKIAISKIFLKIRNIDLSYNDVSVRQFLDIEKQTDNSISNFWEPLTIATLNNSIENSSAKLLITVLQKAFFSGQDNSKLILPNRPLLDIVSPFAEWCEERGSKVLFNEKLTAVEFSDNSISSITSKNNYYKAEDYIFAIPPENLYNILNDEQRILPQFRLLKEIKYSPIVSVYLWLDKEFPDIEFAAMLGTESQWIFNRMKIISGENWTNDKYKARITVTISNALKYIHLPKKMITDICFSDIKSIFTDMKKASVLHSAVVKMKNATLLQTPEALSTLPSINTSIENMFMAGDHTQTGLPATIEAAAYSGKIAAELIKVR